MRNHISKINGDRIETLAISVRPKSETTKIVKKMLDGSYTVQQIGNPGVSLDITVCVSDKDTLDQICASCEAIIIYHYGKEYQGVISSEAISWAPLLAGDSVYKGTFSLVVV